MKHDFGGKDLAFYSPFAFPYSNTNAKITFMSLSPTLSLNALTSMTHHLVACCTEHPTSLPLPGQERSQRKISHGQHSQSDSLAKTFDNLKSHWIHFNFCRDRVKNIDGDSKSIDRPVALFQWNILTIYSFITQTFRPAAMLVEKSSDYGQTWKALRYFAYDCVRSFPSINTAPAQRVGDIICDSKYSDLEPSTDGEVSCQN